jgi:hypothetical protein
MRIKSLQKLKEEIKSDTIVQRVSHLIVGHDIFSVSLFYNLKDKFSDLSFIPTKEIKIDSLLPSGPGRIRGEANVKLFKGLYPNIEATEIENESVYYKDTKFKKFSGRGRPEKLLWGEDFFIDNRLEVDLANCFDCLRDQDFLNSLESLNVGFISTIALEAEKWIVSFTDGSIIEADKLLWGESPSRFFDLFTEKKKVSDELVEFCEQTKTPGSLQVSFKFKAPISDMDKTIFLPLSYTHDWGHFVGEFKSSGDEQSLEFLTYIDSNETSEEDVSRKIKILKKNIEKIFPASKKIFQKEFISLTEDSACLKIDDSKFFKNNDYVLKLFFIGFNAPIDQNKLSNDIFEDSLAGVSHIARGLANLGQTSSLF